jgi:hypothetical protein
MPRSEPNPPPDPRDVVAELFDRMTSFELITVVADAFEEIGYRAAIYADTAASGDLQPDGLNEALAFVDLAGDIVPISSDCAAAWEAGRQVRDASRTLKRVILYGGKTQVAD